jgi:hypothetical protein
MILYILLCGKSINSLQNIISKTTLIRINSWFWKQNKEKIETFCNSVNDTFLNPNLRLLISRKKNPETAKGLFYFINI